MALLLVTVGINHAALAIVKSRTVESVNALDRARALGRAGEQASGIKKNFKHIDSLTNSAKYRIPDGLDDLRILEVKNVRYQGYTKQLEDFYLYSKFKKIDFILITRKTTILSGPIQDLINFGDIILKFLP